MRTEALFLSLCGAALIALPGCLLEEKDTSCDGYDWEVETPDEVVCPGTGDCACFASEVCCVSEDNGTVSGASCSALLDCQALAFECDGPEDCGSDQICCGWMVEGGGSTCTEVLGCSGEDALVICRSDSDCPDGMACSPSGKGAHFKGVMGYCSLEE